MANMIPKEIWVQIWSLVDFKTLQRSCTLVCTDWFGDIRGNTSLSGQMKLNNRTASDEEINRVLAHWEKLRIVHMRCEMSKDELLQLATHPSLEKMIFSKRFELGIWGYVTKVCYDIKNKSSATSVENIVELQLVNFFEQWHWKDYDDDEHQPFLKRNKFETLTDISMEPIARMMLNLETLHIFDEDDLNRPVGEEALEKMKYFEHFFHGLQHCQNLSELILHVDIGEYAAYVPNIKKLTLCGHLDELYLDNLDWIASLEKLEILKLESLRFEHYRVDINDITKLFGKLIHLKSLKLSDCALMYEPAFLMNTSKFMPSLKNLVMNTDLDDPFPMDINYLIEVLDSIGNIKNLTIENSDFQYLLSNKEFGRPILNDLNEDQTKVIFERAMEIIHKKFPMNSTAFEIVDNEYGWSIKKEKGKPPTMSKLPYKCTFKDNDFGACINFFSDKAKFEEHVKRRYGHCYPNNLL